MLLLFFWHHHSIAFIAPAAVVTFHTEGGRDLDLLMSGRVVTFETNRDFNFETKRDLDFMTDREFDFETKKKG